MKQMSMLCQITGLLLFWMVGCGKPGSVLTPEEQLGKRLFFSGVFSYPAGQSCATCHRPERGFSDTLGRAVSEGAASGRFSMRNAMTIAYSAFVPSLSYDTVEDTYVGGLFWDGRVNTLEEQITGPFHDPVEMAATREWLLERVRGTADFEELERLYGRITTDDSLYVCIIRAITAYERSREVNPFSSRFDAWKAGKEELSAEERRGMELFEGKGKCANCHILEPDERAGKVLFTDHTYDNLGIPVNPYSDFYRMIEKEKPYGGDTLDRGLGGFLKDSLQYGKFRVPTLRNIDLTAPYGHNGYFRTLEDIVHFYNVRDVSAEYPEAEYPWTVNREELGNLGLSPEEEAAIVAFMKTFTDGYNNGL